MLSHGTLDKPLANLVAIARLTAIFQTSAGAFFRYLSLLQKKAHSTCGEWVSVASAKQRSIRPASSMIFENFPEQQQFPAEAPID